MEDNSQPLRLIERAIKRIGGETKKGLVVPSPDAHATHREEFATTLVTARSETPARPRVFGNEVAEPSLTASERHASEEVAAGRHGDGVSREIGLNFKELRRNEMITPDNMTSALSNQFRSIKRKLLVSAFKANSRVAANNLVMITSSVAGEGKTFAAVNLAMSLAAERDLHVLLVDGDFVRGTIGRFFESTDGRGLTDLLNGTCQRMSEVLYRCKDIPRLSVMFAGSRDERTPELVGSRRMTDLLADISTRYVDRIVIIDTLPILAAVEPATFAMHVHQLIMVVAAEQTNRSQLRKALETVAASRNISVLFNKAPKWNRTGIHYYDDTRGAGTADG